MSIFSSIVKIGTGLVRNLGRSARAAVPGAQAVYGGIKSVVSSTRSGAPAAAMRALPTVGGAMTRVLPGVGAVASGALAGARAAGGYVRGNLPTIAREVAIGTGLTVAGSMLFDQSGNVVGRLKRRRMNPMNAKAARRAIRRVVAVRKILSKIERGLPRARRR